MSRSAAISDAANNADGKIRHVSVKISPRVFRALSEEAHKRSLRDGKVHGIATVVRDVVANSLNLPPEEDKALRDPRGRKHHYIRHRATGATGCNTLNNPSASET
jgi:hypothetical protein